MRQKKVLVVEDENIFQDVMRKLIKEYDPKVRVDCCSRLTSYDIKEFEAFPPDMILLDWNLGEVGTSGLHILHQIKKNQLTKKIPVVMVTGVSDPEESQKALKYKVDGYLVKPVNTETLFNTLDKFLKAPEEN